MDFMMNARRSRGIMYLFLFIVSVVAVRCEDEGGKCERIRLPMCQDLGYNWTAMPNLMGHKDQEEAEKALITGRLWRAAREPAGAQLIAGFMARRAPPRRHRRGTCHCDAERCRPPAHVHRQSDRKSLHEPGQVVFSSTEPNFECGY
ncbi:Frizzled-4 [Eumeta japonica]|uniref:Frizzled-4 n=1 Tax=Eumeta variegata TaxID=151549 RepID=A0A4C1WYB2_EUMVA|nr:Frizzled-4 [Eumeta japonica]